MIGPYNISQQHYVSLKNFIEVKARQYEHNVEELNQALERANDEEINFDEIAPGNEQA